MNQPPLAPPLPANETARELARLRSTMNRVVVLLVVVAVLAAIPAAILSFGAYRMYAAGAQSRQVVSDMQRKNTWKEHVLDQMQKMEREGRSSQEIFEYEAANRDPPSSFKGR